MKIVLALSLFVAAISASSLPSTSLTQKVGQRNQRLVTDAIAGAIQDLSQEIKDAGLDPLYIEHETGIVALPVPVLLSTEGVIEELLFTGLSNIVINNLNFNIFTTRLTFDVVLPGIELTAQRADLDVTLFGEQYTASASGRIAISNIRVAGNVRVSVGIISGISIRNLVINFSLGGIESGLNVRVQDWDLSNPLNTFLGDTVPTTLDAFSAEINELLEIVVLILAEDLL